MRIFLWPWTSLIAFISLVNMNAQRIEVLEQAVRMLHRVTEDLPKDEQENEESDEGDLETR